MSNPYVPPSLGESVGNALGTIQQALQSAAEQRRQEQSDALKQLVAGVQMQHEQAATEGEQVRTAGDRQRQAEDAKKARDAERISGETQRALGPVLLAIGAGHRAGDPAYDQAWATTIGNTRDPEVVHNLLQHRDALGQIFTREADAAKAQTGAQVAAAQAPAQIATAQAETELLNDPTQRRLAAMHSAGTLDDYLQRQRQAFELRMQSLKDKTDDRSRNAQADLLRRTMVTDALRAGSAAYAGDASSHKPPIETYLENYLRAYAHQVTDPQTGQPMEPGVISSIAGEMIRRSPSTPSPTPTQKITVTAQEFRALRQQHPNVNLSEFYQVR